MTIISAMLVIIRFVAAAYQSHCVYHHMCYLVCLTGAAAAIGSLLPLASTIASMKCRKIRHSSTTSACCLKSAGQIVHASVFIHIFAQGFGCNWFQVTQLVMAGEWSDSQSKEAMELCMGGCAQIDSVARQCLQQAAGAAASAGQ